MKSVTFENKMNHEQVVCDNTKLVEVIDGVEYLAVHKPNQPRVFLMRKDTLEKITEKKK